MAKKIISYILILAGLVLFALNLEIFKSKISFLESFHPSVLLITGAICLILGIVFLKADSGKSKHKQREVPIYKGKEIIGYRVQK